MALRAMEDALRVAVRYRKQAAAGLREDEASESITDATRAVDCLQPNERVPLWLAIGDAFTAVRSSLPAL